MKIRSCLWSFQQPFQLRHLVPDRSHYKLYYHRGFGDEARGRGFSCFFRVENFAESFNLILTNSALTSFNERFSSVLSPHKIRIESTHLLSHLFLLLNTHHQPEIHQSTIQTQVLHPDIITNSIYQISHSGRLLRLSIGRRQGRCVQSAAMPGIIIFHGSKDDLERIFDEKLQPIKDKLDAINKMLDRLTNHGLAPKTPPIETDTRSRD